MRRMRSVCARGGMSYTVMFCCNGTDELIGRAGHFRHFLIFNNKKLFYGIFKNKINNLFLHQSYLKSPLPVKLT